MRFASDDSAKYDVFTRPDLAGTDQTEGTRLVSVEHGAKKRTHTRPRRDWMLKPLEQMLGCQFYSNQLGCIPKLHFSELAIDTHEFNRLGCEWLLAREESKTCIGEDGSNGR